MTSRMLRFLFVTVAGASIFAQDLIFIERFDTGAPGWTANGYWQIGSAMPSSGGNASSSGDPATDASTESGNPSPGGVAGVVIGGLAPTTFGSESFLTSPVIDCSGMSVLELSFDRMLNDDVPQHTDVGIDVFDGSEWRRIWTTTGALDPTFKNVSYDIARYSGPQLRIRFVRRVVSVDAVSLASWTIDNVVIRGSKRSVVLAEDFDDNLAAWTLDPTWQIGPAVPLAPISLESGSDPKFDAPARLSGGIAGVVIGGFAPTTLHDFRFLTSPPMDISGAVSARLEFARFLASDYFPFMESVVDVWNGAAWVRIFTNGTSPVVDANWQRIAFDVSGHANSEFRVRFGYAIGHPGVYSVASWSIDDVVVSAEFTSIRRGDFEANSPIPSIPAVAVVYEKATVLAPWRVRGVSGSLRIDNVGPAATTGVSALGTYGGRVSQTVRLPAQRAGLLEFDVAPDYSDSGLGVRELEVVITTAAADGATAVARHYAIDLAEQPFGPSMWRHVTLAFRTSESSSPGGVSTTVEFRGGFAPSNSEVAIDNVEIRLFGIGAANTQAAGMAVNGDGVPFVPGPFVRTRDGGDSLAIAYWGPPYQPVILAAGILNVGAANIPCLGQIDIGTAPTFSDVAIVASGFEPTILGYLFRLDATGSLQHTLTLAGVPPGLRFTLQSFIAVNDGNCLLQATAAHETRMD